MKVPSDQSREAINTEEAIRHILMDLQVTSVEPAGQFDNAALPVVYFSGKSRSVDAAWDPNANSKLRGLSHSLLFFYFLLDLFYLLSENNILNSFISFSPYYFD